MHCIFISIFCWTTGYLVCYIQITIHLTGELQQSPVFLAPLFSLLLCLQPHLNSSCPDTIFIHWPQEPSLPRSLSTFYQSHSPRYSHGLLPRLQILSSHGSLPWTNYLILKLSWGIPHPPLAFFSPDHIIPHYAQFSLLSHPISQYIWNISSL